MPSRRDLVCWRREQLSWIEKECDFAVHFLVGKALVEYFDFLGKHYRHVFEKTWPAYRRWRIHVLRRRIRKRPTAPPPPPLQWTVLRVGISRVWIRVKSRMYMGAEKKEKGGRTSKGNLAESTTNIPPLRLTHSKSNSPSTPSAFLHLTHLLPPLPTPLPPIPPEPPPLLPVKINFPPLSRLIHDKINDTSSPSHPNRARLCASCSVKCPL
jgi:hypothetical protein